MTEELTALKRFKFGARRLNPGDTFRAASNFAKALIGVGRAKVVNPGVDAPRSPTVGRRAPSPRPPRSPQAAEKPKPPAQPMRTPPKPGRPAQPPRPAQLPTEPAKPKPPPRPEQPIVEPNPDRTPPPEPVPGGETPQLAQDDWPGSVQPTKAKMSADADKDDEREGRFERGVGG